MLELQHRLTDKATFLRNVGTAHQRRFGGDVRDAVMGDYATLDELNDCLGDNTAQQWLAEQVADLSAFSGAKNLSGNQVDQVSRLIAQEYHDLKYSEVALFFHRFKCGDYGKFYGGADPLDVMVAFKEYSSHLKEKRWKFLQEEEEARLEAEEEKRRQQYRHWKNCQSALCEGQSQDVQEMFNSLHLDMANDEERTLLLWATQEAYTDIEGKNIRLFSSVISKFYPGFQVRYRLYTPRKEAPSPAKKETKPMPVVKTEAELQAERESLRKSIEYFIHYLHDNPEDTNVLKVMTKHYESGELAALGIDWQPPHKKQKK